ncbi:uncharacterized protein LY89DRAFT_688956 [Mollisia scopiformis]|uniref:Uncharacterized protein n=1 Tax=Mollisia scopiformis TaxID=149040 RepID=A0A194WW31_MOLSC|nr:uncharacterized protein LY89DRAFT_688956 [Mollisia scopiformis]KUJ11792.1 hypothetical protein LY89DRAFT_688956 [Mollisia scopiformis]
MIVRSAISIPRQHYIIAKSEGTVAQDMPDNDLSSITMIQRNKTPMFPIEWIIAGQSSIYNLNNSPELADRTADTQPLKVSREIIRS